jgi:aldehyde dehydrogenase (NAD+)
MSAVIDQIYINGKFVTPHGTATLQLIAPATEQPSTVVRLADADDARAAIAAAKAAYATYRWSTLAERAAILQRLHDAVLARKDDMIDAMIAEYGGPRALVTASVARAAAAFTHAKQIMQEFAWERTAGSAKVAMEPLGVVGIITPWNASSSFVTGKLAMALAAGSTAVIKPSELSARQTQILTEAMHAAEVPAGLFNIVTGLGEVVGGEFVRSPDIAKISFTGSTAVGKSIARGAAETLKRVTLELGGKSPNILLDDADLATAIPRALTAAFMNNGQACIAGTRLLVPRARLAEVKQQLATAVAAVRVGDPAHADTQIGPLVTRTQFERVQRYIELGIAEGAELLAGGPGHPAGLERGYFVKPTVFVGVTNDMRIAREEIFGPVLSVIAYDSDDDAVRIANDTDYGLQAYVSGGADTARANRVAERIVAGRVFVNGLYDEPLAPFGGFKQSGLSRELGTFGLEAYVEPKAVMSPA